MIAAAVLVVAAVISACGSSSTSSSSTGSASSGNASAGSASAGSSSTSSPSSKVPYVLGVQASLSGPLASSIGSWGPTLQAWADWTNTHGGISGHPVKLIVNNDAGNPTTAVAQVKQLIQSDHVLGVVDASGAEEAFAPILAAAKVPVIGGLDTDAVYWTDGDFFSEGTSPQADNLGAVALAKKQGITDLAFFYCSEVPACLQAGQLDFDAGKSIGVKAGYTAGVSSSAPNYIAPCLAAKQHNVDGLLVSAASSVMVSIAQACNQEGLNVPNVTGDEVLNESLVGSATNTIAALPAFPWFEDSTPAEQAFHQALQKYYPSVLKSSNYGTSEATAWTTGQLFAAAAANLGNNPTAAGLRAGLYSLHGDTLGGLAGPITYTQGKNPNAKLTCYFGAEVVNKKLEALNGGKAICPAS